MRIASTLVVCAPLLALLAGCPAVNSKPCADDSQCAADQRCRRGACGPICLADSECGAAQVCRSGVCATRPECAQDTDCAVGFTCSAAGSCQCVADSSCAANQQCLSGKCSARPRCTADADCLSSGGRCEVTQGLCLPTCVLPQDCAPTLDPNLAFTIYTCVQGTCTRRCTTDALCGGAGFICRDGLCAKADCKTAMDCAAEQYCTSATFGRCLSYTLCTASSQCARNYECKKFASTACPPGFDCNQKLCQELPQCLADGDCVTGTGATATPTGYCEEGHCQATGACTVSLQCATGRECIAGLCVPSVCRGNAACGAGKACIDGACVAPPPPEALTQLRLRPSRAFLLEGETLQLQLTELPIDGSSYPAATASFEVVDPAGAPTTAATITSAGVLTAVSAGEVKVRASVQGAAVAAVEASVRIYPVVTSGRRVIVIDSGTRQPLAGATVLGCTDCTAPVEVVTDALGVALFPSLSADAATFTAASPSLRTDGLPSFERASILGTTSRDVLLPLRDNPVKGAGGFSAALSFSDVSTVGSYWAGFVTASVSDLPSLTPASLLGENFLTQIPALNQSVPVPATVILYTSPAFGIPQQVKPRSLGLAQSGERFMSAWAGRANLDIATSLKSTDVLSYLGAFDYAQDTNGSFAARPFVPDTADVNGNGLCANPQKCPMGTEDVPDYANFTRLNWQPRRQQRLRTEVVVPRLPSTFDTVIVAAVQLDGVAGMLPVGFSSKAAGTPGADGTRKVDPVSLRSGSPYNGLEATTPGVWVLATNNAGTAYSGRLTSFATVPTSVLVTPFLPAPSGGSFNVATRVFNPGQPAWASAFSSGAQLARVSLTGTEVRHVVYFAMQGAQTQVAWPRAPQVPGVDPAGQSGTKLEVVTVDLAGNTTPEDVFDSRGVSLQGWLTVTDGYSRFDR